MDIKHTAQAKFVKSAEDKLLKFWQNFDAELQFSSACTLYTSHVPHVLFNGVLRSRLSTSTSAENIERAINHFKWRKLPFSWWIDPFTTPSDLGKSLLNHGLTFHDFFPELILEFTKSDALQLQPEQLSIHLVDTQELAIAWIKTLQSLYGCSEEINSSLSDLYLQRIPLPEGSHRQFLAKLNGKPIGTAELFIDEDDASVHHLFVQPSERRKGIGTAILEEVIRYAKELECKSVRAIASSQGSGIFRSLGFQTKCQFSVYAWPLEQKMPLRNPYIKL